MEYIILGKAQYFTEIRILQMLYFTKDQTKSDIYNKNYAEEYIIHKTIFHVQSSSFTGKFWLKREEFRHF